VVKLRGVRHPAERRRALRRRIRGISILPSLVTLGNLLSGLAAIHFAARSDLAIHNPALAKLLPTNLTVACYFIFLAMLCDALDGRLARFSRSTSDFGGQLDSLADIVSFCTAPAFIAIRLMMKVLSTHASEQAWLVSPEADTLIGRLCWFAAAIYLACGALRLARFNVENVPDESAHMVFKGLPVPGAAGAVVSLVLLDEEVMPQVSAELGSRHEILIKAMPVVLVLLALLMVSRLPYLHVINRYMRGKKPFWMLVAALMGLVAFLLWPELVLAVSLCGYAVSGPVSWVYRKAFVRAAAADGAGTADGSEANADDQL